MAERLIHRWAGHVVRLPTNHWLAEVVRARAVQCWRWTQQRHTDKWTRRDSKYSGGKISCANGTAMDARRTRGRILDDGRTPKTACLGVVLSSEHSTGHGFFRSAVTDTNADCLFASFALLATSIGDSVRSQKKKKSESESESESESNSESESESESERVRVRE